MLLLSYEAASLICLRIETKTVEMVEEKIDRKVADLFNLIDWEQL